MTKETPLTPAMERAVDIARRNRGFVAAGITCDRGRVVNVSARTIDALIRRGIATRRFESEGGNACELIGHDTTT